MERPQHHQGCGAYFLPGGVFFPRDRRKGSGSARRGLETLVDVDGFASTDPEQLIHAVGVAP
jgi:hypothetical protein